MDLFEIAAWGAAGALIGEVVKAWETIREIGDDRILELLRSIKFWVLFIFVCLMGAAASLIVNSSAADSVTYGQALATGMGAFGLLRGFTGVAKQDNNQSKDPNLGPSVPNKSTITWKELL